MKNIYCISGLGADEKAFARIKAPAGYQLVHLHWLKPLPAESIDAYALRMCAAVTEPEPVLLGLSFGGIMCQEMARHIKVSTIILISSVRNRGEMPTWMRAAGRLKLNKLLPMKSSTRLLQPVQDYHIGAQTKEELEIVRRYRQQVDPEYLQWAIDAILNWQGNAVTVPVYQVHGDADRIFPLKYVHPDKVIKGGTHFMIFSKAPEINQFLASILSHNAVAS